MALIQLPPTTHFAVQYQDAPATLAGIQQLRAQQLRSTCESDFGYVRFEMGVPSSAFGPSNRITLTVKQLLTGYGGQNNGFKPDNGSQIDVAPAPAVSDDAVRAAFVAELVEVLNSQRRNAGTGGWQEVTAASEGISLSLTADRYPLAYYSFIAGRPRINEWLFSPRGDSVNVNLQGESDMVTHGCALLFLHYLRYQLNFSWPAIVGAGGSSLAETYTKLTGRTDAFNAFTVLLNKHIPIGSSQELKTENPFPLLGWPERTATLSFQQLLATSPRILPRPETVHVRPFFTCPEKDYHYGWVEWDQQVRCLATLSGFGQPVASWFINGQPAHAGASITTTALVGLDDPNNPNHPNYAAQVVQLHVDDTNESTDYEAMRPGITISHSGNPGVIQLDVRGEIHEMTEPSLITVATGVARVDTRHVLYEGAFYADQHACERAFHDTIARYLPHKHIPIVKTLPDPPPAWRDAIHWLAEVRREISEISKHDRELARQIAEALASQLGIDAGMLGE